MKCREIYEKKVLVLANTHISNDITTHEIKLLLTTHDLHQTHHTILLLIIFLKQNGLFFIPYIKNMKYLNIHFLTNLLAILNICKLNNQ